jgi:hypothetical protein
MDEKRHQRALRDAVTGANGTFKALPFGSLTKTTIAWYLKLEAFGTILTTCHPPKLWIGWWIRPERTMYL